MTTTVEDLREAQDAGFALTDAGLERIRAADEQTVEDAEERALADQAAVNRLLQATKAVQITDTARIESARQMVQEAKADGAARDEYKAALRAARARGITAVDDFPTFAVRASKNDTEGYDLRSLREDFRTYGRL